MTTQRYSSVFSRRNFLNCKNPWSWKWWSQKPITIKNWNFSRSVIMKIDTHIFFLPKNYHKLHLLINNHICNQNWSIKCLILSESSYNKVHMYISYGHVDTVKLKNLAKYQASNKKIYIMRYYVKKIPSIFDTSPVVSIWLEMSIDWHTTSQGLKKKCVHFLRGMKDQPLVRPHCL